MPITPLDLLSMAPRSQEASQVKQMENNKLQSQQNQLDHLFQQEVKHNSMQTPKTTKAENNEYRYDAKEKGNNTYQNQNNKKKQNRKEENKKEEDKPIKLSNFDVKI